MKFSLNSEKKKNIRMTSTQMIVLSFLSIITAGTILLLLPIAKHTGHLNLIDALLQYLIFG